MGSGFSSFLAGCEKTPATPPPPPPPPPGSGGLEDEIPESCLAMVLKYLDPPEIGRSACLNHAFHRAASADFVWEPKLPENYQILVRKLIGIDDKEAKGMLKKDIYAMLCCPIRFDGGTKEVWMEKNGGVCVCVSWKGMKITGIDDRRYWNHISTLESRFGSIAYLQQIWWLEVEGDLEFEFPAGTYSLFFRLQLGLLQNRRGTNPKQVHGWDIQPVRFQLLPSGGQNTTCQCYLGEQGKWQQYHVGDFVVEDSYVPTKIKFLMAQIDCTHTKAGLCLDSVLICPVELADKFKTDR